MGVREAFVPLRFIDIAIDTLAISFVEVRLGVLGAFLTFSIEEGVLVLSTHTALSSMPDLIIGTDGNAFSIVVLLVSWFANTFIIHDFLIFSTSDFIHTHSIHSNVPRLAHTLSVFNDFPLS